MNEREYADRSLLVHGRFDSPKWDHADAITPPITTSTSYRLRSADRGAEGFRQFATEESEQNPIFVYQRLDDPCQSLLEERLAMAEGGEMAVCFATGMAAISAALGVCLRSGDHVVAHQTIYGCTYSLLVRWLARMGVTCSFVDLRDSDALAGAIKPETRVVYFETPCNPTLDLIDIAAVCDAVREANDGRGPKEGISTILDNTFATPFGQRSLPLGVDLVVHSLTKGISGFGTEMGGAVIGSRAFESDLRVYRKDFGGSLAPQTAWHVLNYGLPTLALRLEQQQRTAVRVARYLEGHPLVGRVSYPGLASFPQRALALRQMRDYEGRFAPGALIYFEVKGGLLAYERARTLMNALADEALCVTLAVSLGQVRTLVEHPASMTHSALSPAERERAGIAEGGVRLSLGIEDARDVIADLETGFAALNPEVLCRNVGPGSRPE
jgi:cystathionine beta-lyase/cystathionine gamma-synthase